MTKRFPKFVVYSKTEVIASFGTHRIIPIVSELDNLCDASCTRYIDDIKRIDAYVNIFNLLGASNKDLFALIIEHNAQAYDVGLDYVCLKVHDDKWKITADPNMFRLYHNSYTVLENYARLFNGDFHLQYDGGHHTFRCFVHLMSHYSWPAHVRRYKEQALEAQRQQLSAQLEHTSNLVSMNRFSWFHIYYTILDCNRKAERLCKKQNLKLKKLSSEAVDGTPYSVVSCRVFRWQKKRFLSVMDALKGHCIKNNHFDYADRCETLLK